FMSQDIVAVDTAATNFFNQVRDMPLESVGHLVKAQELKVGTMNLNQLNIKRIKM
ncbi:MAG TPA: tat (twin-arginine translocation) pathway signal sequence, partial [Paludibacteraceae bacterium]|nr:tat (twin-arginine translocation) pathway signal sequence [Paludibacteraceae bacterium]HRS24854.1 tat (twin-arginine translocation) pathway signal sequence [Paludibacteraceae bacterium]